MNVLNKNNCIDIFQEAVVDGKRLYKDQVDRTRIQYKF